MSGIDRAHDGTARCGWTGSDALMVAYHDREWGVPLRDEARLFELLCLEGAQAGLSWSSVLRRRDGYRAAYDRFDIHLIAAYDDERQRALLQDRRIIRNRAKVHAFRENARATLRLHDERRTLSGLLWSAVGEMPVVNRFRTLDEIPVRTAESERLSRQLVAAGYRFVGPTIVYALMQSAGLVNDHLVGCFRHPDGTAVR
jgi:DNA-3-methyladenine glycosylase I